MKIAQTPKKWMPALDGFRHSDAKFVRYETDPATDQDERSGKNYKQEPHSASFRVTIP